MIGIEGTGSWGAGLARAPGGRRRADPRGHPPPERPPGAAAASPEPDQSLSRRRQGAGRGRRPARGQDRHRPLRTDPGAPGLAPQRDEGPRRRSPADHRPADHRPRRRAHPLRPSQRRGGSSAPWPARAPHRPPTAPASTTTRTLRRLARRHRIPGRRDHRHRHRAARTDRPRRPDDARHQGLRRHHHRHPARRRRRQPRPNPLRGILRRPVRRRPDPRQPPGGPTATDSTAAATDRPTGRCTRSPWSACPATRAPRSTPPASPPRARAAKRSCAAPERAIARQAWHLLTHPRPAPRTDDLRRGRHERGLTPRPSRPPPEHPPGPDQRTRTRHTPRHHPHRSIPPMAQHPTTTDPHHLTPIGASRTGFGPGPIGPTRPARPICLRFRFSPPLPGPNMAPREDRSGAHPTARLSEPRNHAETDGHTRGGGPNDPPRAPESGPGPGPRSPPTSPRSARATDSDTPRPTSPIRPTQTHPE